MEEVILSSDVIARVNLVDKRTFLIWSIPLPEYPTEITWMPLLEFRFRVHEYLKGSGPNELRGLVHFYSFLTTRDEAQLVAAEMLAAHDTRWDQREAIVFLWSEGWPNTSQFEQMPDQYWIGMMDYVSSSSGRIDDETYSVANRHAKAWLPEAPQPARDAARSVDEKLFLLDAPPATTIPIGNTATRNVAASSTTTPTISLGALKSKIATLEAEGNAGGTPEYRECVEIFYIAENNLRNAVALFGPLPHLLWENTIESGLPAGTSVFDHSQNTGGLPDRVGRAWFEGPDKDLFQWVAVDFRTHPSWPDTMKFTWRAETARPLPVGTYVAYPNILWYGGDVCNKGVPELSRRYEVVNLTVTAPAGAIHEAFFDPVAIGAAVGTDGTNGALKPAAFTVGGASATITSLEWESGVVTMVLNPSASLAGHAVDFIALDGSVSLALSFDDATQSGGTLTWSVASQPWNAGDLLMLRIGADATTLTTPTPTPTPLTPSTPTPTPTPTSTATPTPTPPTTPTPTPTSTATPTPTPPTTPTPTPTHTPTPTPTPTPTHTTTEPITVTLTPRVEGSETYVNLTIEWNDPQPCDGQYMVALYSSSDYLVTFMGFHPAPATTSLSSESYMWWDSRFFPDRWAGVSCDPSDWSGRRELGRVSLRAAHPDNN